MLCTFIMLLQVCCVLLLGTGMAVSVSPIFSDWNKYGTISPFKFMEKHLSDDLRRHLPVLGDESCQICLHLSRIVMEKFEVELPRAPKKRGARDILINNLLNDELACDYHSWTQVEKKFKGLQNHEVLDRCKRVLADVSEELEIYMSKYDGDFIDMQEHICVNTYHFCASVPDAAAQIESMAPALLNQKIGQEFFAWNKKNNPQVQETSTGMQYIITKKNDNDPTAISPKSSDKVYVDYRGYLLNGNEFDSSYARNAPMELGLNQVIAGWTEGMQLLKEGETGIFFIPSFLAYSYKGSGSIGPNEYLIFEIHLRVVNAKLPRDPPRNLEQYDPEVAALVKLSDDDYQDDDAEEVDSSFDEEEDNSNDEL